jgi:hypothetical protein
LNPAPRAQNYRNARPLFLATAALLSSCLLAAITAPVTLQAAHQLLEHLIR